MSENIVVIRPSFMTFCGKDACRSAAFNQILYSIGWKVQQEHATRKQVEEGKVQWYQPIKNLVTDLAESWEGKKITREIDTLVKEGLLGRCHNEKKGWDRTMHYFFGKKQGQKLAEKCKEHGICLLCLGLPKEILHLLFLTKAISPKVVCKFHKDQMHSPKKENAFSQKGGAIPKVLSKDTYTKDTPEEEVPSSRSAPPSSSSVLKFEKIIPDNEDKTFKAAWETSLFPLPADQTTWRAIRTFREAETSADIAIESYRVMQKDPYWKIQRGGQITITNTANNIGRYATQAILNLQEQSQRSYDEEKEPPQEPLQSTPPPPPPPTEQAPAPTIETVQYCNPETGEIHTTQLEHKYGSGRKRNDLADLFGSSGGLREKVAVAS